MLLAIDIGSKHIHIVEGEYRNRHFKISRQLTHHTPEGCVMDGEIVNEQEIITKLKHILEKEKMHSHKVAFTINPGSMISQKFIIPDVKTKEALGILQNEMESAMQFSEPHVVDYTDIEKTEEGTYSIEAVALSRKIIKQYMDFAKKLKLIPVALDIHQNTVYKLMLTNDKIEYHNIIVADIGNNYMNTYLYKSGKRVFSKRTMINTDQYERTLVSLGRLKRMNDDFKHLDLSPEAMNEDPVLGTTLGQYLNNIVDQLQRVVQFYMSLGTKGQMGQISHIYLCGGMANMCGIEAYIESYMDIKVSSINEMMEPSIQVSQLPQYINCIGALIRVH